MAVNVPQATSEGYVQIAYVVPDGRQAALEWVARGAGPFYEKRYVTEGEVRYRNKPATLDHISFFGQYGAVMLELIEPVGTADSVYRDLNGPGDSGLHHFARICPDLEQAIVDAEAQGFPLACRAGTPQTPVAFVDARAQLGHMIELCQDGPSLRFLYQFVAEAARDWDGSEPLRMLAAPTRQ